MSHLFDYEERKLSRPLMIGMIALLVVVVLFMSIVVVVPANNIGLRITWGQLENVNYPEGLYFKSPIGVDYKFVPLKVNSVHVIESTASSDMQEISTQLSVQYKVIPTMGYEVYRNYLFQWEDIQIKPIIFEELKATTADWTAEELIKERPLVMAQLRESLTARFNPLGFVVVSVNIEDLQFSEDYWNAIERKAVATQDALTEKNKLEVVRYQKMQEIIVAEANKNITILQAEAERISRIRVAEGEAFSIILRANATAQGQYLNLKAVADGVSALRLELTPEYIDYLLANGWDGKLPLIVGGDGAMILDIRELLGKASP